MKYRQSILIFIGLGILLLLTGCSPWVEINQSSTSQWLVLDAQTTVGQTFVADYSGLQAVYISLRSDSSGDGALIAHLRSNPESTIDLASASFQAQLVNLEKSYQFTFQSLPNSNNQYYYIFLSYEGSGAIEVGSGPTNSYQNGSAYKNHNPLDAQLTFNLEYNRLKAITGIFQNILQWIGLFIVGLLMLSIPGWSLLSVLWKGWLGLSKLIKLTLSIGVSMGFYTLFVLFTFLINIQLGKWYAWIPVIVGGLIILWQNRTSLVNIKNIKISTKFSLSIFNQYAPLWLNLSFIIVFGLLFLSRFWVIRGLSLPMWNDSVHHTVITQLILDHSGLFNSWLPYTSYGTFSMHFGFPLISALFAWLSNIDSGQAVLYIGQMVNIFAVLALYPLAVKLTRGSQFGGVVTVLIAGILSPMPAYYVNWGRYAQLAAQVILPIAIWMVWEVTGSIRDNASRNIFKLPWAKILLTGAVIAGMLLFEYRMVYIILTFILAWAVGQFFRYRIDKINLWLRELWAVIIIGLTGIILFLPWGLRLSHGNLLNYSSFSNNINTLINLVKQDYQTWQNILFYVPLGMIILAVIGWVWSVIKKDWLTISLGIWIFFMSAVYALILLRIPWAQYVQSFAVIISLYIPLGLLIGYLTGSITKWLHTIKFGGMVAFTGIIILGFIGAWGQRDISDPATYGMVTQPDLRAMAWIKQETPPDSLFLVEGMHQNWLTNIVGTDAGWWIPLLTGRQNTMPPQYAISNEVPIEQGYSKKLIALENQLEKTSLNSQAGISLMCEYGITHIYIGQKQGMVGNKGQPLFSVAELSSNPIYHQVYHQDEVYIYSVEGACDQ